MQWRWLAVLSLALLAPGFLLPSAAWAAGEKPVVDLELLLAIDISGSVDPDEAKLQREGYAKALVDPQVVKAIGSGIHGRIAISYFEWADAYTENTVLDWTVISDMASAKVVAAKLLEVPIRIGRRTSISGAINAAIPRFKASPYQGLRKVLDISGDGPNNAGDPVDMARDKALAQGIVINGLPIINDRPNPWGMPVMEDLDRYYEGCVIGGPGSFVVVAESFDTFHEAVRRKLVLEIASAPIVPRQWGQAGPPVRLQHPLQLAQGAYRYPKGCDAGERQSQEFWRRRFDQ